MGVFGQDNPPPLATDPRRATTGQWDPKQNLMLLENQYFARKVLEGTAVDTGNRFASDNRWELADRRWRVAGGVTGSPHQMKV
jgi:hypothetical protein